MARPSLLLKFLITLVSLFVTFESVNAQVTTPSPIQSGQVGNCIGWRYVAATDTCANIVTRFQAAPVSLTLSNLLLWNPALGSNCQGLTQKTFVCVRIDPSLSTTPAPTSTSGPAAVTTPTPIQTGQVGNCIGWRYVATTDTCANIVTRFQAAPVSLTLSNLLLWNPALGSNCQGLTPKFFVCVRIDPSLPTSTTTRPTTTTSRTTTPSTTPIRTTTPSTTLVTTTRSTTTTTRSTTRSTTTSATPANTYTPIVGAGDGSCANRLKIQTMQTSQPNAFNLLLLALRVLQDRPDTDDLSFYQLSGIHGAPFIPWQMPASGQYDRSVGYCTHHSVIFTTWHRPYLLILEQAIYEAAKVIANSFTGTARTTYVNALAQLRLPYWDWADPVTQSSLPSICMQSTVQVTRPNTDGSPLQATISNPLYAYTFKSSSSTAPFGGTFAGYTRTLRSPSNGVSRDSVSNTAMQNSFTTRKTSTFNIFGEPTYNDFSNAVENIHDDVHGRVGGGGHMSYVPFSSFDPIFWLHHVNVDRLTAMYQACNPGRVLQAGPAVGTFARPSANNAQDNINSPLYPFRLPNLSWWTSANVASVSSTWLNGYGYPEVPCSYQSQSSGALDSFTTTEVNRLYNSNSGGAKVKARARSKRDDPIKYTEFEAKVVIDQSELVGSFAIYIYLGQPEKDYTQWPLSGKEIGSLFSLGFPERSKMSMIRSATIPISPVLEEKGIVGSVAEISAYLEKELTWVCLNNGVPVDVKTLKTLKVAITTREITYSGDADKLPTWGRPKYHLNVSDGKNGGATSVGDVEDPTLKNGEKGKPATGAIP